MEQGQFATADGRICAPTEKLTVAGLALPADGDRHGDETCRLGLYDPDWTNDGSGGLTAGTAK